MNLLVAAVVSFVAQGSVAIPITTRDMTGLHNRQDILRGTCDGRAASLTITKAYRGATGRLVLRGGRWTRDVSPAFLGGRLVTNSLQSVGIGCDGRRLQVRGRVLRTDSRGEIVLDVQNVVLDLRTGMMTMDDLRTLTAAETRAELR